MDLMDCDAFTTPTKATTLMPPPPPKQVREYRLPTSKSFKISISLSDLWKPKAADPVMQWVQSLPSPKKHQDKSPVQPARYRTLKHTLDHDSSGDESAFANHPQKRTKTSKTHRSVSDSHRNKLVNASRGLVRRISDVCQRATTPNGQCSSNAKRPESRAVCRGPTPTPSLGTPDFALIDRPKMRFVLVGDAECGKSSILLRFYRDACPTSYTPTHYGLFHKTITVDGQETDIELWDTAGDSVLEQLQRLSYLAWDAVLLCFGVNSVRSFNHARTEWMDQIRRHTRGAPVILVGNKTDQRVGPSLWAPLYPDLDSRITATEGTMTGLAIGAIKYVECSAKTGQGINGVFEEGVRAVVGRREAMKRHEKSKSSTDHLAALAGMLCFK